jgi:hypothetical protein
MLTPLDSLLSIERRLAAGNNGVNRQLVTTGLGRDFHWSRLRVEEISEMLEHKVRLFFGQQMPAR